MRTTTPHEFPFWWRPRFRKPNLTVGNTTMPNRRDVVATSVTRILDGPIAGRSGHRPRRKSHCMSGTCLGLMRERGSRRVLVHMKAFSPNTRQVFNVSSKALRGANEFASGHIAKLEGSTHLGMDLGQTAHL